MKYAHVRKLFKSVLNEKSDDDQRSILNREDEMGVQYVKNKIYPLVPDCCQNVHIEYSQDEIYHVSSFYLECKYKQN